MAPRSQRLDADADSTCSLAVTPATGGSESRRCSPMVAEHLFLVPSGIPFRDPGYLPCGPTVSEVIARANTLKGFTVRRPLKCVLAFFVVSSQQPAVHVR